MNKDKPMTAAELLAKLQKDDKYQEREASRRSAREQRQSSYDEIFRPFLIQMQNLGLKGSSLQDIVKFNSPLSIEAVDILLNALGTISEPRILESIVRALGAAALPFDGQALMRCFESTDDEALKWVIVNTISLVHPHSIEGWLSTLIKSRRWNAALRDLEISG